ncbi:MAG: response regulator transcription factor [Rhodospirillaceae bacterium]|nr:response regulator transcription factor [Rhodospirillaceae bacterium]
MPTRILIADDHVLVADTIAMYLDKLEGDVSVDKAASLGEVVALAERGERYDLVILDLKMPGMNGLNGLQRAREMFPGTPVAIMSGYADPQNVEDALRLGAIGFLPKMMSGRAMLGAVRLMLSGEQYVPSSLIQPGDAARHASAAGLSRRELDVLRCLKAGYPNKRIAAELGIEPVTVALHLRNAFRKIGAANRADAVRILIERGLLDQG